MLTLRELRRRALGGGHGDAATLVNPATEEPLAERGHAAASTSPRALEHARERAGPALRALTFAERGELLRAMCDALQAHRDELLELAVDNGGNTRGDAKFDIDGATVTLSAYAELGEAARRRDASSSTARASSSAARPRFHGQHIAVPRPGVAVHVNAFNFPAWGLAEKAACALLAGMPVISKPATARASSRTASRRSGREGRSCPRARSRCWWASAGDLLDHLGPAGRPRVHRLRRHRAQAPLDAAA